MNFKFTKIKTIVSSTIAVIIFLYYFIQPRILDGDPSIAEVLIIRFAGALLGAIIFFIPIYLIWSFFEKANNKTASNKTGIIIGILLIIAIVLYIITKIF